jgi:cell wall-associated NlpC family hydrolase
MKQLFYGIGKSLGYFGYFGYFKNYCCWWYLLYLAVVLHACSAYKAHPGVANAGDYSNHYQSSLHSLNPHQSRPNTHPAVLQGVWPIKQVVQPWQGSADQERLQMVLQQYWGIPYSLGATGPDSLDCSSYVRHVYWHWKRVWLPRRAAWQMWEGAYVEPTALRMGDLLFFGTHCDSIEHVGIFLENNTFAHAAVSKGVSLATLNTYWQKKLCTQRRIIPLL